MCALALAYGKSATMSNVTYELGNLEEQMLWSTPCTPSGTLFFALSLHCDLKSLRHYCLQHPSHHMVPTVTYGDMFTCL